MRSFPRPPLPVRRTKDRKVVFHRGEIAGAFFSGRHLYASGIITGAAQIFNLVWQMADLEAPYVCQPGQKNLLRRVFLAANPWKRSLPRSAAALFVSLAFLFQRVPSCLAFLLLALRFLPNSRRSVFYHFHSATRNRSRLEERAPFFLVHRCRDFGLQRVCFTSVIGTY